MEACGRLGVHEVQLGNSSGVHCVPWPCSASGSWSESHALHERLRRSREQQKLFLLEEESLWFSKDREARVWV